MISRSSLLAILLVIAALAAGCGSAAQPAATQTASPGATAAPTAGAETQTITDAAGRQVTLASRPRRIISLAPSNTEILYALGLGDRVVAVDELSDYPAEARQVQKIGGSQGTYNLEQIVGLQPDLILAAGITSSEVIKSLADLQQPVVVASVTEISFENVFASIELVGRITGQAEQAQRLTADMQREVAQTEAAVAGVQVRPRVYWELDATDPTKPFTVGPNNFIGDMIAMAQATNIFSDTSTPYPQVSSEQVVAADPEVIILADADYGITVESVLQRPGWQATAAVRERRVYPIDSNLVSRPGPRLAQGFREVARLIHPELVK